MPNTILLIMIRLMRLIARLYVYNMRNAAQKTKSIIKDFFSKCDQI